MPRMMDGGTPGGAALLALLTLAACAGDDVGRESPAAGSFRAWDSAGVRIVESAGNALETILPWAVDTVPDLQLGQVDGVAPLLFEEISGIVGLPDGGFVVLDGGSAELRWFDSSGAHVRTIGGRGQGPGEFLDPVLLPRFQADSLLIFDQRGRAFSWIAIDGSTVRRLLPGGRLFIGIPRVSAGSRALFASASSGLSSCPENERCELLLLSRWVDVAATGADTLAAHTLRMLRYSEPGRPAVLVDGAFDQKGVAAVGPDGPVLEGDPRFELRQYDAGGRLIAIFRVDAPSRGAPEDALDRYVQPAPDPDGLKRVYEMMGLPDVLPAFQALRVDRLGWYWAELFRVGEAGASEWLVFDPDGRARGIVEMPSELEVHEIGESYILGRWTDQLGVEYVRRHALPRRGG